MRTTQPFATATAARVRQDAETGLVQLAAVYPGLDWNGKATQSIPHRSRSTARRTRSTSPASTGTFGGYEAVRQGGVLFAGEHTSTDFQGFMEGGAEQGRRAARELPNLI
jgi:monoamine oxidase